MLLQKHFSHPSFSYLLFSNHTHKTKTGIAIGGRLLIATHLVQSKLFTQSETQGAIYWEQSINGIWLHLLGSSRRALEKVHFSKDRHSSLPIDSLDMTPALFPPDVHFSKGRTILPMDSLNMTAALRPPDVHFPRGHTSLPMGLIDMTAALRPPDVHVAKGHFQWIHWIWLLHLIQDFEYRPTYWAQVEMLLICKSMHRTGRQKEQ